MDLYRERTNGGFIVSRPTRHTLWIGQVVETEYEGRIYRGYIPAPCIPERLKLSQAEMDRFGVNT